MKKAMAIKRALLIGLAVAASAAIQPARASELNINWASSASGNYTGQGFIADPGNNTWNNLTALSSSSLVYSDGTAATGVSVTATGSFVGFSTPNTLQYGMLYSTGTMTFTITGLVPNGYYELAVMAVRPDTVGSKTDVTVGVTTQTAGPWTGATLDAQNWAHFASVTADGSGNLTFTAKHNSGDWWGQGYVNALQLKQIIPAAKILTFGKDGHMATIDDENGAIAWTVPHSWVLDGLDPSFTLSSGATCDPVSGTARNFETSQSYVVTSGGTPPVQKTYTVTATKAPASSACDILSFSFGPSHPAAVIGDNTIYQLVSFDTDISLLGDPTITISPYATVTPPAAPINFTTPQVYRVTAEDGTTYKDYTVTVVRSDPTHVALNINWAVDANSTYTGQGLISDTGNNTWNNLTALTSSSLIYSDGTAATGVGVTATGGVIGLLGGTTHTLPYSALTTSGTATITLSGLVPNGSYQLAVMAMRVPYSGYSPKMDVTVGAATLTAGSTENALDAQNWANFTSVTADGSGTLTFTAKPNSGDYWNQGYVEAFQLKQLSPTTTQLVSSVNPAIVGHDITFTATVLDAQNVTATGATGSITFAIDDSPVDTVALADGQASYTTNAMTIGSHTVTATYSGDSTYGSSNHSISQEVSDSPYLLWASNIPGFTETQPAQNPDNDGLNNELEFAFGTDPMASTGEIVYLPGGNVTTPGAPKIVAAGASHAMVFGRKTDYLTSGPAYVVQFSADLDNWVDNNDATNPPVQVATDGSIEAMSVPYPDSIETPSGPQTPKFSRLKVVMP